MGPEIDQTTEGEIGNEVLGREGLHGGGTGVVTGVEPVLNTGTVVRDAGTEAYGRPHNVHGNWTPEQARNGYVQFVPHHFSSVKKKEICSSASLCLGDGFGFLSLGGV